MNVMAKKTHVTLNLSTSVLEQVAWYDKTCKTATQLFRWLKHTRGERKQRAGRAQPLGRVPRWKHRRCRRAPPCQRRFHHYYQIRYTPVYLVQKRRLHTHSFKSSCWLFLLLWNGAKCNNTPEPPPPCTVIQAYTVQAVQYWMATNAAEKRTYCFIPPLINFQ